MDGYAGTRREREREDWCGLLWVCSRCSHSGACNPHAATHDLADLAKVLWPGEKNPRHAFAVAWHHVRLRRVVFWGQIVQSDCLNKHQYSNTRGTRTNPKLQKYRKSIEFSIAKEEIARERERICLCSGIWPAPQRAESKERICVCVRETNEGCTPRLQDHASCWVSIWQSERWCRGFRHGGALWHCYGLLILLGINTLVSWHHPI